MCARYVCPYPNLSYVLPINQYATARHIIKPIQQPRNRTFTSTTLPNNRNLLTGPYSKAHIPQNRHTLIITETHILKRNLSLLHHQLLSMWRIRNILRLRQYLKHPLDIKNILLNHTIIRAQKPQRLIQLQYERLYHHKITHRHILTQHLQRCQEQGECDAERDDEVLTGVEYC